MEEIAQLLKSEKSTLFSISAVGFADSCSGVCLLLWSYFLLLQVFVMRFLGDLG
jgi:hypothetical protein